jgi:glucose/arabinose dehydrogenase
VSGGLALGSAFVLAACGGGGGTTTGSDASGARSDATTKPTATKPTATKPTATNEPAATTTTRAADLAAARVQLTPIAAVPGAIALATRPRDATLYVAQQAGTLLAVRDGVIDPTPVLDLTAKVLSGGERGFLGVAFSPDGKHLAVHYSGLRGQTVVEEYPVTTGAGGSATVDPASARQLFTIEQPQRNHNGGQLAYDSAGLLYLGLGDGGGANDIGPGHAPQGNGQSIDTFLAKILRIDPGNGRVVRCHTGLRNPWRFSFDRGTGDLWIGDVGQNAWEEIDWLPDGTTCGANLGWPIKEGTHALRSAEAPGTIAPVFETSHTDGDCAIVGGYVYRGKKIPDLVGSYLFGDNCNPRIRALRIDNNGALTLQRDLGIEASALSSFGEGNDGELYVLSLIGGLFRVDPA